MEADEVKRRIRAARILRDFSQVEMDALGVELLGLDQQELSRTERGDLEWTQGRAMFLCRVLNVPPRWFEADSIDEVVGLRDQRDADALDLLLKTLRELGLGPPPTEG